MLYKKILRILVPLFVVTVLAGCRQKQDQSIDNKFIDELMAKMSLDDKIGQLSQMNSDGGVKGQHLMEAIAGGRVGAVLNETQPSVIREMQRVAVEESPNGIPLLFGRDVIHGFKTIFPVNIGMAATFNPDLIREGAAIAAKEATSVGINWNFAPMVDVVRDPRWGRMAESFGEDPLLVTRMGLAMLQGFQGDDLSLPATMAACAKHFAGYGAAEGGRDYNTTSIPEVELWNTYFPPFQALTEAGVATFMTGFNELNGVPASGNHFLFREVLKEKWQFRGFVVSDWASVSEMKAHGFAASDKEAAARAIQAGVDMEMAGTTYAGNLKDLVQAGMVSEAIINEAVRRILKVKWDLGLFTNPYADMEGAITTPPADHLATARETALQSLVLLKNDSGTLPLSRSVGRLAIVGPMADDRYEQLGTWIFDGDTNLTITPLAAIRELLGSQRVLYARGLATTRAIDQNGFQAALDVARRSDAVVVFAGEESILTGEAHCRSTLELPGAQNDLIRALSRTGKPLVLVVMTSRPLSIGDILPFVDAVVYAWHPGTMGGPALADVLFGVESPSGKLPVTFPQNSGQIPIYYAHKNTGRPADDESFVPMDEIPVRSFQTSLGNTSHYLDIGFKPLYPFGFGLSYTTFTYSDLTLSPGQLLLGDSLQVEVSLTNSGRVEAVEVVQLYVRDKVASITRPVKELKDFKRVRLKPGETVSVTFALHTRQLGFFNAQGEYLIEPGEFSLWVGGSSEAGLTSNFSIQ